LIMGPILQNDFRGYRILSILAILFFITLTSLFFNYLEFQMLSGMTSRNSIPSLLIDLRQGVLGNLQLLFLLGALFLFVKWFKTAYYNLHQIDSSSLKFTPKWAIGCWFMPVYNLYHPYQIMKEVWEKTQLFNYGSEVEETPLLKIWWALIVINGVARVICLRLSFQADTLAEMLNASQLNVFCDIVSMLMLFVSFSVIHKVMEFEKGLFLSRNNLIGA
jgi:hypothetical protein